MADAEIGGNHRGDMIQRQEDTVVAGQSYSIRHHMTEVNVLSDEGCVCPPSLHLPPGAVLLCQRSTHRPLRLLLSH